MRLIVRTAVASLLFTTLTSLSLAEPPKANVSLNERTRVFAAQKCQYMLPADQWSWADQPTPHRLFAAENANGWVVIASCAESPERQRMDQPIAEDFKMLLQQTNGEELRIRDEGFVSFLGLSCYQIAGTYADGRTTLSRFFLANGLAYHIMIIGGTDPIELQPEFEKAMGGFAFTEPPVAVVGSSTNPAVQVIVGGLGLCFVLAVFMRVVRCFWWQRPRIPKLDAGETWGEVSDEKVKIAENTGIQPESWRPLTPAVAIAKPTGLGKCRFCGYGPLAYGAPCCPLCTGKDPNPSVVSRFAGRGAIGGLILGASTGVIWGLLRAPAGSEIAMMIVGVLLGSLAGVFVGIVGGLFLGVMARLAGNR